MKTFGLLLLTGTSLSLSAQLAPQQDAPLSQHLLEVNAQWAEHDAFPSDATADTHFTNEAARIATHLRLVREHLLARTPEGLSADQLDARLKLLDDLGSYADRGSFPQNHVLPYRNPVFIDPDHTACAVGQLMIESGNAALAERISAELNLGYVSEILADDRFQRPVAEWANAHGFTADELAWIQPGYPPMTFWSDLDGGTDSTIHALLVNGQGELVVAGSFMTAGMQAHLGIALWDGAQYAPLGNGLNGTTHALIEHNGMLYAGGSYQNGQHDVAVWDGTGWTYGNAFPGLGPIIHAFHDMNGTLYASGESSGFAGVTYAVHELQGAQWMPVGMPFNGSVRAFAEHDGRLVVGGLFNELGQFGGTPCEHIAELVNGDWQQLGTGIFDPVYALHDRNGTLMAGGRILEGTTAGFGLAMLEPGSTVWSLPQFSQGSALGVAIDSSAYVNSFIEHNGDLYIGGSFSVYGALWNTDGSHAAQFIDSTEDVIGVAWMAGEGVNALASLNGQLVVAGLLNSVNMTLTGNIASSELGASVPDLGAGPGARISPVPADREITVQFEDGPTPGQPVEVIDATGKCVLQLTSSSSERLSIDVSALLPGGYHVQWQADRLLRSARFVKL
ncbi:MAG: hypothetical protein KDB88_05430 [Flavobacteriales bacterium]|nr:hypothetical protein [Flavobacteriales bacterium]